MAEPIVFPSRARPRPAIPDYATGTVCPADAPRLRLPALGDTDLLRRLWYREQARSITWKRRAQRLVRTARRARHGTAAAAVWGGLGWFLVGVFGLALGLVG